MILMVNWVNNSHFWIVGGGECRPLSAERCMEGASYGGLCCVCDWSCIGLDAGERQRGGVHSLQGGERR